MKKPTTARELEEFEQFVHQSGLRGDAARLAFATRVVPEQGMKGEMVPPSVLYARVPAFDPRIERTPLVREREFAQALRDHLRAK